MLRRGVTASAILREMFRGLRAADSPLTCQHHHHHQQQQQQRWRRVFERGYAASDSWRKPSSLTHWRKRAPPPTQPAPAGKSAPPQSNKNKMKQKWTTEPPRRVNVSRKLKSAQSVDALLDLVQKHGERDGFDFINVSIAVNTLSKLASRQHMRLARSPGLEVGVVVFCFLPKEKTHTMLEIKSICGSLRDSSSLVIFP